MPVEITDTAKKRLKVLPENVIKKVYIKIRGLLEGKTRFKRLQNSSLFSCRVGDYRILFDIDDKKKLYH